MFVSCNDPSIKYGPIMLLPIMPHQTFKFCHRWYHQSIEASRFSIDQ